MQYEILRSDDIKELELKVKYRLKNEWELQGGVCVEFNNRNSTTYFYQAMVKKD